MVGGEGQKNAKTYYVIHHEDNATNYKEGNELRRRAAGKSGDRAADNKIEDAKNGRYRS